MKCATHSKSVLRLVQSALRVHVLAVNEAARRSRRRLIIRLLIRWMLDELSGCLASNLSTPRDTIRQKPKLEKNKSREIKLLIFMQRLMAVHRVCFYGGV